MVEYQQVTGDETVLRDGTIKLHGPDGFEGMRKAGRLAAEILDELVDQLIAVRQIVAEHDDVLCNVGTVTGGGRTNVVPGAASADIGFRFVDPETEKAVLTAVTGLEPIRAAKLAVRVMSNRPAWEPSPATDELLAKVTEAGRSVGQQVGGAAAAGAATSVTPTSVTSSNPERTRACRCATLPAPTSPMRHLSRIPRFRMP